jgi:metal-responsive CopG/Arc/MetJ family transcriptional regulator
MTMKVVIAVPDELFSAADLLAARLGVGRSELYATALAEFVANHGASEITARLDAVYATESSILDSSFRRAQARTIGRERWS